MKYNKLRPEEKRASKALACFLKIDEKQIQPGDDPPDLYFILNGKMILAEITQLAPFVFRASNPNTAPPNYLEKSRVTEDAFGTNVCKEIRRRLKGHIHPDKILCITFETPLKNATRFRQIIAEKLLSTIQDAPDDYGHKINVCNNEISIKIKNNKLGRDQNIICISLPKTETFHQSSTFIQAQLMLNERISKKSKILEEKSPQEEKHLILLDEYHLADFQTYKEAYAAINIVHCFTTIYIVNSQNQVEVLYDRSIKD